MPHIPGTLLFIDDGDERPHKHHVGVYVGAGQLIQEAGARSGIIRADPSGWTHWGLAPWMQLDLRRTAKAHPTPPCPWTMATARPASPTTRSSTRTMCRT